MLCTGGGHGNRCNRVYFRANALNRRQQAALVSAYALVSRSYNDYQRKVKELHGIDAHRGIMEALAAEKEQKQPHLRGHPDRVILSGL